MYQSEKTLWRFTVPQAGEVDSAESVEHRMVEIDRALIGPMRKAELLSQGHKLNPASYPDGDKSTYSKKPDEYWSTIEGRPVYTTTSHYHPMPSIVMQSNKAASATYADSAAKADTATKLTHGIRLNGHYLTGGAASPQVVDLDASDIPNVSRVYWGASKPQGRTFAKPLRAGDVYIQVY